MSRAGKRVLTEETGERIAEALEGFSAPIAVEEALAIVCNGNTAPANIASGKYLFIKNHSTLPAGGYHSIAAITAGSELNLGNVEPDEDGIANSLSEHLAKSTLGELLWSNSSNLGATTISIPNLYTYDEIRIVWNDADSGDNRITYVVPLVGTTFILCAFDIASSNDYGHAFNMRSRIGRFVNEGIGWENGQMIYNGSVYRDWTNRAIPKKIYGIKYT